jgi:hypothetical protein
MLHTSTRSPRTGLATLMLFGGLAGMLVGLEGGAVLASLAARGWLVDAGHTQFGFLGLVGGVLGAMLMYGTAATAGCGSSPRAAPLSRHR